VTDVRVRPGTDRLAACPISASNLNFWNGSETSTLPSAHVRIWHFSEVAAIAFGGRSRFQSGL
jgi:hypothetical protein